MRARWRATSAIALGTVAHLDELRRTRNGAFSIADAMPLDDVLAALDSGAPTACADQSFATRWSASRSWSSISSPRNVCATATRAPSIRKFPRTARFSKWYRDRGELVAVARATSRVTAIVERIFNLDG